MSVGRYSFLPWVRGGLASELQAPEGSAIRATLRVDLTLTGSGGDAGTLTEPIQRAVEMFGPGDVVGIESKAIIKVEPQHWITNFEPNYLPYIDFYDEDFPWRYTPVPPVGHRLTPWIMLVVLEEDEEFEEVNDGVERPLPAIRVKDAGLSLPPPGELWAWAHVHVNRSLNPAPTAAPAANTVIRSVPTVADDLEAVLAENPDLAYARILSPRRLKPSTAYHAFLVPTYETGRLAGLGHDPNNAPNATHAAWGAPYPDGSPESPGLLPAYHRWFFRTGANGDFEQLVRLLQPKPADVRVGRRKIDVLAPGANLPAIDDSELAGVLLLEGALRVPRDGLSDEALAEVEKYEEWAEPRPHVFQQKLAELVNLSDDYQQDDATTVHGASSIAAGPDPVVTPPIYGRWHARVARLLENRDGTPAPNTANWVHELNLDPRWRTAAGFGTEVVQQHQERYMNAAWGQLGDVLTANRLLRFAQFAKLTSTAWHTGQVAPLVAAKAGASLQLMGPLMARVNLNGQSAAHTIKGSRVPPALLGPGFRRVTRPRGRVIRRLTSDRPLPAQDIITRVDQQEVEVIPPKRTPEQIPTVEELRVQVAVPPEVGAIPSSLANWAALILGIVLIVVGLLLSISELLVLGLLLVLVAVVRALLRRPAVQQPTIGLGDTPPAPAEVDLLPSSPNFEISKPGDGHVPQVRPAGGSDSPEAIRFKGALRDLYQLFETSREGSPQPTFAPLDVASFAHQILTKVDPQLTFPKRVGGRVVLPQWIADKMVHTFVPAMAYPVIDQPMYEPLAQGNPEKLVPNLQYIGDNTVSLLETNQAFIEAYMVGVNHEFARELLWREYPTDQRGSCFRQFWDASGYLDTEGTDPEVLKEKLRDIPKLHLWSPTSRLGEHDHRESGSAEEELVLVIRGELLKRYPNAVLYAQKARWQRHSDGRIDRLQERRLLELTATEAENPPPTKLLTPLYEARVDPDIFFFGFDLTASAARGGTGENDDDDAGWFFVIKERPGEPRFGLDVESDLAANELGAWNDLAWTHVLSDPEGKFLPAAQTFSVREPPATDERHVQWLEDRHMSWTPDANAADLAYILFQAPVMVAIHATEMIRES